MKIFINVPHVAFKETFFTPKAMAKLESLAEVSCNPYDRQLSVDELAEFASDADIIVTSWGSCKLFKKDIERFPNLKMIAHAGGTVATIAAPDLYETDVKVITGNDVFAKSVAEGCLCYILSSLRRIEYFLNHTRNGGWRSEVFENRGLFGKKIGIVGFGTIAQHFVNMIRWFDLEVLIYSSHLTDEEAATYGARTASLKEIFSECDIISIHASNTPKTVGMVPRELMEMMKPDALLVNTARGAIIDEPAMFEMLLAGRFYAALDVFAEEPVPVDSPIRKAENVFIMPHMGGPTIDMREVVTLELCKDIERFQKSEELKYQVLAAAASRMTGAGMSTT